MLKHRLASGAILIPLLIGVLWLDDLLDDVALPGFLRSILSIETFPPGVPIFVLCLLVALLGVQELWTLFRGKGIQASRRVMSLAAMTGLFVSCLVPTSEHGSMGAAVVSTASIGVLIMALAHHTRARTLEGAMAACGSALVAFVYLGLMFGFVLAIRRDASVWTLLWILGIAKGCDTGAYFTGKSIGRHKLIEWVSPKKTWEGLFGGVVVGALVGASGGLLLPEEVPSVWVGLLIGAVLALTGQFGDLIASVFKRDAGIKDSSTVLPGLGGVIDVLDSLLLVLPVAYWWLRLV